MADKKNVNTNQIESLVMDFPERKSLGEHVYERVKKAIIDGEMEAGSRIIENHIAEALGISRTPVREAIHKLDRTGFLKRLPSGGFIVASLSRERIEEVIGIRSILESYAARLATEKHKDEEIIPLEEKLEEYRSCLKKGQLKDLNKINTEFHDMLYSLSRSPILMKIIGDLKDQISRFRNILLEDENLAKISDHDHNQMLKAMKNRNPDEAEKLVREHILRGQKIILKKLKFDIQ